MPPPGRKPKPAAQRRREGNPGKRPIIEGIQGTGEPEKPKFLSPDASEEWDRVVPQLVQLGVVTSLHTASLTAMCVFWGIAEAARSVYEVDGLVEEGSTGQMVEHPLVGVYSGAIASYMRIAVEFGLTASAAMRIETAKGALPPFHEIGTSPRLKAVK